MLPLLPVLAARHPQLDVELSLQNRAIDLVAEVFDIGIRRGAIRESSLVARRIAHLPLVLVTLPGYLKRRGVPSAVADLDAHQHESVRLPGGREIPWRFRGGSSRRPRGVIKYTTAPRLTLSDPEALIELALAHAGIAQAGLHHTMPYLRSGRLKAVLTRVHDAGEREIVPHYLHRQYLAPRVRVTVDALLEHLAADADQHATCDSLAAD